MMGEATPNPKTSKLPLRILFIQYTLCHITDLTQHNLIQSNSPQTLSVLRCPKEFKQNYKTHLSKHFPRPDHSRHFQASRAQPCGASSIATVAQDAAVTLPLNIAASIRGSKQ